MTNQEVYQDMLYKLRQYATATLYPEEFDTLWNIEMLNYLALRASEDEKNEKRNQDLQMLKVIDEIANTGGNTPGTEIFELPYDPVNKMNTSGNPGFKNIGFYRIQNVDVKGTYLLCDKETSLDYETAWPWIKDDKKHVNNNPFRKPKVDLNGNNIYYEQRGFKLYIHADNLTASMIRLEYLRYPEFMDVTNNPTTQVELPVYVIHEIGARLRSEFLIRNGNPAYQASLMQQKTVVN